MIDTKNWTWKEYASFAFLAFILIKVISNAFGKATDKLTGVAEHKENQAAIMRQISAETSKASYPTQQYNLMADTIYAAGTASFGTDEKAIYSTFEKIKTNNDYLRLLHSFGKRRLEFSAKWGALPEFLRSELNQSEINRVNDILKKNNVKYFI